jgi:hypothetical protein
VPAINRTLSLVPSGWEGHVVIVLEVRDRRYAPGMFGELLNGLEEGEMDRLIALLADLGHNVVEHWNGRPRSVTGSVALARPANPALLAAVTRYRAGCPNHHTVFCPAECGWFRNGYAMLNTPERAA